MKFARAGFDAATAGDGQEGLEKMEKEEFSLIVLDLVMPRMDGFGVLAAMKEKGRKTPVVVLSNLSQEDDERRVRELGAREYFIKSETPISAVVERSAQLAN